MRGERVLRFVTENLQRRKKAERRIFDIAEVAREYVNQTLGTFGRDYFAQILEVARQGGVGVEERKKAVADARRPLFRMTHEGGVLHALSLSLRSSRERFTETERLHLLSEFENGVFIPLVDALFNPYRKINSRAFWENHRNTARECLRQEIAVLHRPTHNRETRQIRDIFARISTEVVNDRDVERAVTILLARTFHRWETQLNQQITDEIAREIQRVEQQARDQVFREQQLREIEEKRRRYEAARTTYKQRLHHLRACVANRMDRRDKHLLTFIHRNLRHGIRELAKIDWEHMQGYVRLAFELPQGDQNSNPEQTAVIAEVWIASGTTNLEQMKRFLEQYQQPEEGEHAVEAVFHANRVWRAHHSRELPLQADIVLGEAYPIEVSYHPQQIRIHFTTMSEAKRNYHHEMTIHVYRFEGKQTGEQTQVQEKI